MTKKQSRLRHAVSLGDPAAGNGILNRRIFLEGALVSGTVGVGVPSALAEPLTVQSWMKEPGAGFTGYGPDAPCGVGFGYGLFRLIAGPLGRMAIPPGFSATRR